MHASLPEEGSGHHVPKRWRLLSASTRSEPCRSAGAEQEVYFRDNLVLVQDDAAESGTVLV